MSSKISTLSGLVTSLSLLALGAYLVFFIMLGYVVPPGYVGVRLIKFGPSKGFVEQTLAPGLHWGLGEFYTVVHLVPQTVQLLHFDGAGGSHTNSLPSLEIQTADRATVNVDLTVLSRIFAQPHVEEGISYGGVKKLAQLGVHEESWRSTVRRAVEEELKKALGTVRAGDFYLVKEREDRVERARQAMNGSLSPYSIKIERILLRRYTYREERIDDAIFQKNLQEQEERYNNANRHFEEARADYRKVESELQADIDATRSFGENQGRVIKSEGDLYESQKKAQGDLEVAKARAEVDKLRASAFAQVDGVDVYVARELASIVSSLRGGLVTQLDPYDLDAWLKRLGVRADEVKQ